MRQPMTITLDEAVCEALRRTVGQRRMSKFIEDLIRPHVLGNKDLVSGYRAMAKDAHREAEAQEWSRALGNELAQDR